MGIFDWFFAIFIGTILANYVIKTVVDIYIYVKRRLKDNK